MTETINCLDCGRQLLLPDDQLGRMVQCPGCAREFIPTRENGELKLEDMGRALHTDLPAPTYHVVGLPVDAETATPAAHSHPARHRHKHGRKHGGWRVGRIVVVGGVVFAVLAFFIFFTPNRSIPPIDIAAWHRFAPSEAGASVLLPGTPSQGPFPDPNVNGTRYVLQYDGSTSFVFAHADQPAEEGDLLDRLAAHQRDVMCRGLQGELVSEEKIGLGQHQGREIRIENRRTHEMAICRLYLATNNNGSRLYLLAASGPRIKSGSIDAVRFFESFELDE